MLIQWIDLFMIFGERILQKVYILYDKYVRRG